ncbi:hypothetical protein DS62_06540 [Smithella sp. SC_K08D17]|jgi:amphi-Trp domain-containing protein|nr:hypothetical protein KD27_08650 [Smithella sp. D17]KIE17088.1 hypothetical protein DS62_06540 [Smithella sp. SC_K08D17]MDD5344211.1 amphi-Trp domain-containing protein [Smithella sp.]MDD5523703.1 amphi-Trp domain-containing protein [Smithella sp.]
MGNSNLKIKSTLNRLEVVNHLEQLVASLKAGTVCIRKGEKAVTLTPCDPVTFELEAEGKLDKESLREKLSIELKWKKSEAAPAVDETFTISHQPQDEDEN